MAGRREAVQQKRRIKVGIRSVGSVLKGSSSNPGSPPSPIETGLPCRPGGKMTRE